MTSPDTDKKTDRHLRFPVVAPGSSLHVLFQALRCSSHRGLGSALLDLSVKYTEYPPFCRVLLQLKCLFFEHLISWSVAQIEQHG